jgi:hypothetical protein
MSRSLTDGLVVVIRSIGHCGHRTSIIVNFYVLHGITWKKYMKADLTEERNYEYTIEFSLLQDA